MTPALYQASPPPVSSQLLHGDIAYLQLPGFFPGSADQVLQAVKGLAASVKLRGVILDLCGNGGGSPAEVSTLPGRLHPRQSLVLRLRRARKLHRERHRQQRPAAAPAAGRADLPQLRLRPPASSAPAVSSSTASASPRTTTSRSPPATCPPDTTPASPRPSSCSAANPRLAQRHADRRSGPCAGARRTRPRRPGGSALETQAHRLQKGRAMAKAQDVRRGFHAVRGRWPGPRLRARWRLRP
jgi:hypothetical protein